ncbi:MAG: hypothetical protein R3B90_08860 [Planctomycetaceae bacterium]
MNLLIVGDDPELIDWSKRVIATGHQIAAICAVEHLGDELQSLAPQAHRVADWQSQLNLDGLSAAIIGGTSREAAEQAEFLAERLPLLVLPHAAQTSTGIATLDYQVNVEQLVTPALLARHDPAIVELIECFRRGELGDLRLLRMERTNPADAAGGRSQPETVRELFLHDADLLMLIGGDYRKATALQMDVAGDDAGQTTITLSGIGLAEASWRLQTGPSASWSLDITGTKTTARLSGVQDGATSLEVNSQKIPIVQQSPRDRCLNDFLSRIDRTGRSTAAPSDSTNAATATRPDISAEDGWRRVSWRQLGDLFAVEAAFRESLRRQRTVAIAPGGLSERSEFKSQMTAVGCGVLTWALLGTCLGLLFGKLADPRDRLERRATVEETILWNDDFQNADAMLTESAQSRLRRSLSQVGSDAIVLIEADADQLSTAGEQSGRVEQVRRIWEDVASASDPPMSREPQIEVRRLSGRGFHRLMIAIWVATFGPLAVFLVMQGLIVLAR